MPTGPTGGVYQCLNSKRGSIIKKKQMSIIKACLPVAESFGFTCDLRGATQRKAFPQCVFSHWELVKDLPLTPGSKAEAIVKAIRKRKGIKEELPRLEEYVDKL